MKRKTLVLAGVLLMAASSCSMHDDATVQGQQIDVAVGVAQTRAGYSGTDVLPESFVMDVEQGEDVKYDYLNVSMVRSGNTAKYVPEGGVEMLWAGSSRSGVKVKAMTVPYGLDGVDAVSPMTVGVDSDQSMASAVTASDLLVCTSDVDGDVKVSGNNIKIRFRHLMTKLDISYKFSAGLSAQAVSFNSVTLTDVCVSGGYSYAEMDMDESIELAYDDVSMYEDKTEGRFEAIFFPYVPTTDPKLIIDMTVAGEQRLLTCDVIPKSAEGFESGKRYTMSVTIGSNNISPTSIGISSGWDAGTEAGTGAGSNEESFETE